MAQSQCISANGGDRSPMKFMRMFAATLSIRNWGASFRPMDRKPWMQACCTSCWSVSSSDRATNAYRHRVKAIEKRLLHDGFVLEISD